jgi:hypothetical protein
MSPDEREAVTRSIANLWTFNAAFMARLVRMLRDQAVPAEALGRMLQELDGDVDALEGEDEQAYATNLLAMVRRALSER